MDAEEDGPLLALWAKTGLTDEEYHPLLHHLLDVGYVARMLLLADGEGHWRGALARLLGVTASDALCVVPLVVALHDIGKCAPSFQRKSAAHWRRVVAAGFAPAPILNPAFSHDIESWRFLYSYLPTQRVLQIAGGSHRPRRLWNSLAMAIGAHHGEFLTLESSETTEVRFEVSMEGWQARWRDARLELAERLRREFAPGDVAVQCHPTNLSALCIVLNGFTILCDWIGSDERYFPPSASGKYTDLAKRRAEQAVSERELVYPQRLTTDPTFEEVFPRSERGERLEPRPVQRALDPTSLPELPRQALVIIEAPTGEGKTEAALLVSARLAARLACQGFYFALPTIATSAQMYRRVSAHLQAANVGRGPQVTLANSQAMFSADFAEALRRGRGDGDDEGVVADSWFLPRKKSLLSPYGVGTIDQALIGALNVRHVSLRLLGLTGKVLIIDEVHAYDVYMTCLLERLLEWLGELGTSVVLLSATLPRQRRERLLQAFVARTAHAVTERDGQESATATEPYPLVTVVDREKGTQMRLTPSPASASRTIRVQVRPDGEGHREDNARFLARETADGGCAAWIVNTVAEAQRCFVLLKDAVAELPERQRPELILYHARFLLEDRRRIEDEVLRRFGPDGDERPNRAIVVATQVIEQSLDLDFDLMMTQLAPIDLLLQRAGRLFRHRQTQRPNPRLSRPRLVVLMPPLADDGPSFGGYGTSIYEPFVLLKTIVALGRARTLRQVTALRPIKVPRDVRRLVESVYDGGIPDSALCAAVDLRTEWLESARKAFMDRSERDQQQASVYALAAPDVRGHFYVSPPQTTDDSAEEVGWISAQTRLEDKPSIRLVLVPGNHPLLTDGGPRAAGSDLSAEETRYLLSRSVSVSDALLCQYLRGDHRDPRVRALDRSPALRGYHLLALDGPSFRWPTPQGARVLTVDPLAGVLITTEGAR